MGLMFPRLARNFAKNGYYPTDEATLERSISALAPSTGTMRIIDPCAGEGVAIAEAAHALGREAVQAYAVEYDRERAQHTRGLVDHVLQGDLFDTMISRQAFGLLWFNPPYGAWSQTIAVHRSTREKGGADSKKRFTSGASTSCSTAV